MLSTRRVGIAAAIGLLALWPVSANAQAAPATHCQPGEVPQFVYGFAVLRERAGTIMGSPVSCEFADPRGTGDVLQLTSTGLAFWRKSTNTPTFTNGPIHIALTPASPLTVVVWETPSIDPPTDAAPAPGAAEYVCDYDLPPDLAALHNCP
jgi:hypothetical protein